MRRAAAAAAGVGVLLLLAGRAGADEPPKRGLILSLDSIYRFEWDTPYDTGDEFSDDHDVGHLNVDAVLWSSQFTFGMRFDTDGDSFSSTTRLGYLIPIGGRWLVWPRLGFDIEPLGLRADVPLLQRFGERLAVGFTPWVGMWRADDEPSADEEFAGGVSLTFVLFDAVNVGRNPPPLAPQIGTGRLALAGNVTAGGLVAHFDDGTGEASLFIVGAGIGGDWLWPVGLTTGGAAGATWSHSTDPTVVNGASTLDADLRVGWLFPIGPYGIWPRVGAGVTRTETQVGSAPTVGLARFGSLDFVAQGQSRTFATIGVKLSAVDLEPNGMDSKRLWSVGWGFSYGVLL